MWAAESSVQALLVQEYRKHTDAPEVFLHTAALSVVAASVGKNVGLPYAGRYLTPCLWLCLVGRSTRLRKTTVLELARQSYLAAFPESKTAMLPPSFSLEGFLQEMLEAGATVGPSRHCAWWVLNELGSFLTHAKKRYNEGALEMFTDIYDVPAKIGRVTKGAGLVQLQHPLLNILAGTTVDWLVKSLDDTDLQSGFLPRWNFIPGRRNGEERPYPVSVFVLPEAVGGKLRKVAAMTGKVSTGPFATHRYHAWAAEFARRRRPSSAPGAHDAFVGRLLTTALKVSILAAVGDERLVVSVGDVEFGIAFAEQQDQIIGRMLEEELGFTRQEKRRFKIVHVLRAAGFPMRRTDLLRVLKFSVKEMDFHLDTLVATGIVVERQGSNRSREYLLNKRESGATDPRGEECGIAKPE